MTDITKMKEKALRCRFCFSTSSKLQSHHLMASHEDRCYYNDKNRACYTCENYIGPFYGYCRLDKKPTDRDCLAYNCKSWIRRKLND